MTLQQLALWASVIVAGLLVLDVLGWNPIRIGGGQVVPSPGPRPVVRDKDILSSLDSLRAAYIAAEAAAESAAIVRDEARAVYSAALDQANMLLREAMVELNPPPVEGRPNAD